MLRRPPKKILLNSFDANTVLVVDGTIHIKGFGSFKPSDVVACSKVCATDGQLKVVRLGIVIPDTCECPETYDINIVALPDLEEYETDSTFDTSYFKEYEHPTGATFTAAQAAAGLTEQINADPSIPVTAVQTDGAGTPDATGTFITLTQKEGAPEYNAYNVAGTVTVVTPYIKEEMSDERVRKIFPIQWGHFGSNPDLPNCGTYCRYRLKIQNCCATESDSYDISMDRALQGHEIEVEFYTNQAAAGFEEHWVDVLEILLDCLNGSSSSSS